MFKQTQITLLLSAAQSIRFMVVGMVLALSLSTANAANVVVTIPPLASIVQPLLSEDDQLTVLLKPGMSPHGFQLKPSHLKAIQAADLVISVGNNADAWAEKALTRWVKEQQNSPLKQLILLQKLPGLVVFPQRIALFKSQLDPHGHHEEGGHDHHADNAWFDNHVWLSFTNAALLVKRTNEWLKQLRPNDGTLDQRSQQWLTQLVETQQAIAQQLKPVQQTPYLVLHDAFQYFEKSFGLNHRGAVQLAANRKPSVKRVLQLRALIEKEAIRCVFKEPQFSDTQLNYITRGLKVGIGSIDPIGLQPKPLPYTDFMSLLANQFATCLTP